MFAMRKGGTTEEALEKAEKRGFDTGLTVPPSDRSRRGTLPVWVANFILMDYGTGAIFGCPAHDQRDLDFARKYGLSVTSTPISRSMTTRPSRTRPLCRRKTEKVRGCELQPAGVEVATGEEASTPTIAWAKAKGWARGHQVPPARLGPEPPALLGLPHPSRPLRGLRRGSREEGEPAGRTAPTTSRFDKPGNPLDHHPTWRRRPAQAAARAAARNGHDGHVRRLVLVFRPLHRAARDTPTEMDMTPRTG
jgi:leucyl-tRNA synthetase